MDTKNKFNRIHQIWIVTVYDAKCWGSDFLVGSDNFTCWRLYTERMLERNQKRQFLWSNTKYFRLKVPATFGIRGKGTGRLDLHWFIVWVLLICFPCLEEDEDVTSKPAKEQYLVTFFESTSKLSGSKFMRIAVLLTRYA